MQVLLCVDDVGDLGLTNAEINELSLNGGKIFHPSSSNERARTVSHT